MNIAHIAHWRPQSRCYFVGLPSAVVVHVQCIAFISYVAGRIQDFRLGVDVSRSLPFLFIAPPLSLLLFSRTLGTGVSSLEIFNNICRPILILVHSGAVRLSFQFITFCSFTLTFLYLHGVDCFLKT